MFFDEFDGGQVSTGADKSIGFHVRILRSARG
jgi:hypothetical protein